MKKKVLYSLSALTLLGIGLYPTAKEQIVSFQQEQTRKKVAEQALAEEKADLEVIKNGQSEVADNFYYQQLTQKERADYIRLVSSLRKFDTKSPFTTTSASSLNRIYLAVMHDFPEFYWLSETGTIDFYQLSYPDDAKETYTNIQHLANQVIAKMPDGSDYDKVKYLYEYVIQHTQYNTPALTNETLAWQSQSVRSAFLDQLSVCAGYSRAFQLLCQKAGIPSIYVVGDIVAYDIPHAWNYVRIDGNYYPIDTTWGDPTFESDVAGQQTDDINYGYLCTPKELFESTHTAWTGFTSVDGGELTYPALAANALNYYVLTGAYFEAYDQTRLSAFVRQQAQDQTKTEIAFQLGSQEAYDAAFSELQSPNSFVHDALGHLPNYSGYEFYGDTHTRTISIKIPR